MKNTENVQAAERKDERSAAVMSYSTLETNNRHAFDLTNRGATTFDTFQSPARTGNSINGRAPGENIYDQIPNEQFYDAPYEMRNNDEVYEPEPPSRTNVITINGKYFYLFMLLYCKANEDCFPPRTCNNSAAVFANDNLIFMHFQE